MNPIAWLVVLLLILANALYVAAEFAAVSVRNSQIRGLAQHGNAIARRMLPTLEDSHKLDAYIAACQIGITLSSLILGAFGQATFGLGFAAFLEGTAGLDSAAALSAASITVLVLLTATQVIFGELIPKSLALQFPTRVALVTYLPTYWSAVLYRPFIAVLNGSGWFILRRLGISSEASHHHIHSPEEIEMLLAESRDGGLLEPDEQHRLHRALQLSRRTAHQLMVPRREIVALSVSAPTSELLSVVTTSPYTRLPVYQDSLDNIVGIIHTKDVAAHFARSESRLSVNALLRPALRVPEDVTADRLLTILREERARMAVVVGEYGGTEGIVTLDDLLSELVGGVADEFKEPDQQPEWLPDGQARIPGWMLIEEARPWTGVLWEDDEADTVGGRVVAEFGYVPAEGERITIDGVDVQIEHTDGQAITSLLVRPRLRESDADEEA